jgi:beta-glucosidase
MKSRHPQFRSPSPEIEQRINRILQTLTLDEKLLLLGGQPTEGRGTVEIPGKVPAFKMADGPVGVHWWTDKSTAYPACIGLAASFNRKLAYRMGEGLGRDARARGVHIMLAPGVNLYRSPLCGRNFEYLGEDPALAAGMVTEVIRGVQDQAVATTIKHLACNFQEYDRHGVSSDVDERTLREMYLPAFEAAIRTAGSACLMTAYNSLNGRHCSEHDWLITTLVKGEWGFDGIVMSDWDSVYSTIGPVNAGLDLEMPYAKHMTPDKIKPALANGTVSEAMIDDKVRRLLRVAACFGWLDHEQKDESIPQEDRVTIATALEVARESLVLLKNDGGALPLDTKQVKKIVVLGYHAAEPIICGGGSAYTPPHRVVTLLEGLRQLARGAEVVHFPAVKPAVREDVFAQSIYETEDGGPGITGEYFTNRALAGAPALVRVDPVINFPWEVRDIAEGIKAGEFSVRWTGYVRPAESGEHRFVGTTVQLSWRVWLDGKLILDNWNGGTGAGEAMVNLEAGRRYRLVIEAKPFGLWTVMRFGWEPSRAQYVDYDAALAAAREADAVIVSVGFVKEWEGEGFDRSFALNASMEKLIEDAAAANGRTIVMVYAGGAVDMRRWIDRVRGLLYVWYPGQEGGLAMAEALLGKINPSGKLPATFERRLEDRSSFTSYHDADEDKRVALTDGVFGGYRHFDRAGIEPLFPFGFGLSYTTFAVSNLRLSASSIPAGGRLTATVDITNTGPMKGAEVVQLYIRDVAASHPRPVKELKDFAKVSLKPGQTKTVSFKIGKEALRYWNPDQRGWTIEPGEFEVLIGTSSRDIHQRATFTVTPTSK